MFDDPYKILNLKNDATIDEVKKSYRKIALKSHPDKLNNIIDIDEKNTKIKEFTDASNAYNQILNNDDIKFDYNNWEETFDYIINSKLFKEFINILVKKPKIISHTFNLDITYSEYYSKNKKKIRLFLKDCKEPIFIDLDCKKYPKIIINYNDDIDNEKEHELIFNLKIINNNNNYYHISRENGEIDIIYDMLISTIEYITGNIREHVFLNNDILLIKIEPFTDKYIINGLGINNGNFVCNFIYIPINKKEWNKLNDSDKTTIISIFNTIKN